MGFNLNSLKIDKERELEGVWVDYVEGSRLLIGRIGNHKFKSFISMKYKAHRMAIDRGDAHADVLAEEIQLQAYSKFILLGWEGIEVDGKEQKYTPELAQRILTEFSEFKSDVENFANETNLYLESAQKQDVEKLKKP